MSTLLKPILVREELLNRGMKIFSIRDFRRLFDLSDHRAKYFLEKESKAGFLWRLKKGLYGLKTDMPAEEEIANRLYRPSYISFEYALGYYNILPEMSYWVSSATTKATRDFEIEDKSFAYFKIKRQAYTGYKLVKEAGKSFLMAEPEKAVADYLYFVALGKKPINERLNIKFLDKRKIKDYTRLFGRGKLLKLVDKL